MHELGVANEILNIALSESDRHAAKKVVSIRLRVGVLRAIEPGNLSFLFGHVARGTPADGAVLEIDEEPVRVDCPSCGVSEARSIPWECQTCGGAGISATGGESLEIVSLELDV
ncbi:MAG: hydrogenase maturation nickel metallochaperone HypA [Deltaproteobacteria bacterium]|nr:MAG: hydrogenase maturation nickel metallochaperone HypA [Deltaproteobacteria bacterium]